MDKLAGWFVRNSVAPTDLQALIWDNTLKLWKPGAPTPATHTHTNGPYVYDRIIADVEFHTSIAETTIYTKTIAASDLSTNRTLRLILRGDYFNNFGAATARIKVKFGGTIILDTGAVPTITANGGIYNPWEIVVLLNNEGAANAQRIQAFVLIDQIAGGAGVATTGNGSFGVAQGIGLYEDVATKDTASAQDLLVSVQLSASGANLKWRTRAGLLEML